MMSDLGKAEQVEFLLFNNKHSFSDTKNDLERSISAF